jgi:phospholipid-transporting ATPase
MITGDKQATAENIALSCKLFKHTMHIIKIIANSSEQCKEILDGAVNDFWGKEHQQELGVVIDGTTLDWALEQYPENFMKITSICHSVVCCRVSPLQKALIVRLMKKQTHEVCLSIGDGANDVSMIQEAHIGVGIFGKEGTQAARSSDYAIREFRHLRRLLTVHGRYSYVRNSGLIQYSIYKNTASFLVQFWYAFYSGYSATVNIFIFIILFHKLILIFIYFILI